MTDLALKRLYNANSARKNTKGFTWSRRFWNKTYAILKRRIEQERTLTRAQQSVT